MNNAKMWLVVKPTVGIPLFLSAVAIGSFAVHVAVVTNTSWVSDYLQGKPLGSGDKTAMIHNNKDATAVKPAHFQAMNDGDRVVVVFPDGKSAVAVIERPEHVADATGIKKAKLLE